MQIAPKYVLRLVLLCCFAWPVRAQDAPLETRWNQLNEEAKQAYTEKHYAVTETNFTTALRLAEAMKSDWRIGYSHDALAYFYRLQGQPAAAKEHYNQTLMIFSRILTEEDQIVKDYLEEVAEFYLEQGWRGQFMDFMLDWTIQGIDANVGKPPGLEGMMLAMMMMSEEETEKAKQREKKYEAIFEKLNQRDKQWRKQEEEKLDPVEKKANAARARGDQQGVVQVYREAVREAEKMGLPSEVLAQRLEALANIVAQQENEHVNPVQTIEPLARTRNQANKPASQPTTLPRVSGRTKTPAVPRRDPGSDAPPAPGHTVPPGLVIPKDLPVAETVFIPKPTTESRRAGADLPRIVDVKPKSVTPAQVSSRPQPNFRDEEGRRFTNLESTKLRLRALDVREAAIQWEAKPQQIARQLKPISSLIRTLTEYRDSPLSEMLLKRDIRLWTKAKGADSFEVAQCLLTLAKHFESVSNQRRSHLFRTVWEQRNVPTVSLTPDEKHALELVRERQVSLYGPRGQIELEVWVTGQMKAQGIQDRAAEQALSLRRQAGMMEAKIFPQENSAQLRSLHDLEVFFVEQGRLPELVALQQRIAALEAEPQPRRSPVGIMVFADDNDEDEGQAKWQTLLEIRRAIPIFDLATWSLQLWRPTTTAHQVGPWVEFNVKELLPERNGAYSLPLKWSDIEFRTSGERLFVGVRSRYGVRPLRLGQFGEINLITGALTPLPVAQHAQLWETARPIVRKPHEHQTKQAEKSEKNTVYLEQIGDKTGSATSDSGAWQAKFKVTSTFERKRNAAATLFGGNLTHDLAPTESHLDLAIYEKGTLVATKTLTRKYQDWGSLFFWEPNHPSYRPMSWIQVGNRTLLLLDDVRSIHADAGGAFVLYVQPAN